MERLSRLALMDIDHDANCTQKASPTNLVLKILPDIAVTPGFTHDTTMGFAIGDFASVSFRRLEKKLRLMGNTGLTKSSVSGCARNRPPAVTEPFGQGHHAPQLESGGLWSFPPRCIQVHARPGQSDARQGRHAGPGASGRRCHGKNGSKIAYCNCVLSKSPWTYSGQFFRHGKS